MLKKVGNIFNHCNRALALVAGVVTVFVMLAINYEVFMRYFLNRPTLWTLEISEYSLVYITFLGAAWVLRKDGHVKIDLLVRVLKPRSQIILNIITSIMGAGLGIIFTWYSAQITWGSFRTNYVSVSDLEFPLFLVQLVIPIGCFLLFVQFLRNIIGFLSEWKAIHK